MSVTPAKLKVYGAQNISETDPGSTQGGAVNSASPVRYMFNDLAAAGALQYVSESAGDTTQTVTVTGRDSSGTIQSETKTLTGVTPVAGAQSFLHLLKGTKSATCAGAVAVESAAAVVSGTAQAGSGNTTGTTPAFIKLASGAGASCAPGQVVRTTGGTGANQIREIISLSGDIAYVDQDWATVPDATTTYRVSNGFVFEKTPSEVMQVRRPFYNVAADVSGGSVRNFYEKAFFVNTDPALALTAAAILIESLSPSLPAGCALEIALCNALNDTGSVATRQTAPAAGITAFTSGAPPQTINVPTGSLPGGAAFNTAGAQGVWLKLTLAAGAAAYEGNFVLRGTGTTT